MTKQNKTFITIIIGISIYLRCFIKTFCGCIGCHFGKFYFGCCQLLDIVIHLLHVVYSSIQHVIWSTITLKFHCLVTPVSTFSRALFRLMDSLVFPTRFIDCFWLVQVTFTLFDTFRHPFTVDNGIWNSWSFNHIRFYFRILFLCFLKNKIICWFYSWEFYSFYFWLSYFYFYWQALGCRWKVLWIY